MRPARPPKSPRPRIGWAGALITVLILVGVVSANHLPAGWKPWEPLTPAELPGPATRWKLQALSLDPSACRAFLRTARMRWQEVPDRREGDFCAIEDAVRLEPGALGLRPNVPILRCPVAAGLVLWRRHGLEPLADQVIGARLVTITHMGSYNCRRQRGNSSRLPSEHATANAIDISGFGFADGSTARLPGDWQADTAQARYLREAQKSACEIFKVVLGPQANAAHADHFHLDMGPFLSCR